MINNNTLAVILITFMIVLHFKIYLLSAFECTLFIIIISVTTLGMILFADGLHSLSEQVFHHGKK